MKGILDRRSREQTREEVLAADTGSTTRAMSTEDVMWARTVIEARFNVRLEAREIRGRLTFAEHVQLKSLTAKQPRPDHSDFREIARLVELIAPGLIARATEAQKLSDEAVEERLEAAYRAPRPTLTQPGDATLPAGVLDDVLAGLLQPIDLALLSVFALTFSTGRVEETRAKFGLVTFDGEDLVVGSGGRDLFDWPSASMPLYDRFNEIVGRLVERRWLVVDGGTRFRPGARLEDV